MNQPIPYTTRSPREIEQLAAGDAILLDVREQDEWTAGHLEHAKLLCLSALQEMTSAEQTGLSADKPIFSHCRAGVRSVYAAAFLRRLGIECEPLQQGFEELLALGLKRA
ncbi:MAG: rhodanese-like domain-containing protein [Planctomycetales bacterium]|nr:rhodanese-like domain-containing protein [Planctomycetales bacterium]